VGLFEKVDETCGGSHQWAAGDMVVACRAGLPFGGTRVRAAAADPFFWDSNPVYLRFKPITWKPPRQPMSGTAYGDAGRPRY
jgi:hypothetical protein